jgi:dCTP deaminase
MIYNSNWIAKEIESPTDEKDPLVILPGPSLEKLSNSGAASIDLRLGTWFVSMKTSRHGIMDIYNQQDEAPPETSITDKHYVQLGNPYIIHPNCFVLAATLEWVRMPKFIAGYVTGKSSWGRRGLVIETAPGVHPGFSGCLTLEIANVGEVPIKLIPGTPICQLFFHGIKGDHSKADQSSFIGQRQPVLGKVMLDEFVQKMMVVTSKT